MATKRVARDRYYDTTARRRQLLRRTFRKPAKPTLKSRLKKLFGRKPAFKSVARSYVQDVGQTQGNDNAG
jgi:hypothetical protein